MSYIITMWTDRCTGLFIHRTFLALFPSSSVKKDQGTSVMVVTEGACLGEGREFEA